MCDKIAYSMYRRSSVATFPEAPFAYGHPPSPATEESIVRISFSKPTKILANACPYVSWQCMASWDGFATFYNCDMWLWFVFRKARFRSEQHRNVRTQMPEWRGWHGTKRWSVKQRFKSWNVSVEYCLPLDTLSYKAQSTKQINKERSHFASSVEFRVFSEINTPARTKTSSNMFLVDRGVPTPMVSPKETS
mmetsp:Transcript_7713/g.22597  ORF Transcript_7713/g.22597 Transcript_7713/m.22597 type:complete len:192 (+) Transcript_7713:109-684(+)